MIEINSKKRDVLKSFIDALISKNHVKKLLLVKHSEFGLFDDLACEVKTTFEYADGIPTSGSWDLIVADLPIGMKSELSGKQVSYALKTIDSSLNLLSDNGLLIAIGEPQLITNDSRGIRSLLRPRGCSLLGIINAPEGLLRPYTDLRAPFFIIQKKSGDKEFIAEFIDSEQARQIAISMMENASGDSLDQGIFIESDQFDSFPRWKARQQIKALETEYKNFSTICFGDLLKTVNTVEPKGVFQDHKNSLYIHKVGTKAATSKIENLTSNHSNFYQCVCDELLVDADYLESFFSSKLGKLIMSSLSSGAYIPSITMGKLKEASISIPPLDAQKSIVNSIYKLRKIKGAIGQFEDDLALNPISSDQTLKQIDFMLEVVGGLADSDKVMSLIRDGESKQTEFKETLTVDVKKQTKEKYIETSAIKTIAAFMNSAAGTLIVGVNDSGEILGIDNEIAKFYRTHDAFLLKFRNLIKERIGGRAYDFIDYRLVKIGVRHVLIVECKESPEPIYVDENDFYVRTNPATDKLDGPSMVTYITNHFVRKSELR